MRPLTIPALLAARAAEEPGHTALLLDGGEGLTAAQWHARSTAVGHGLLARGVRPGDRVGLVFGGHDWLDYAVAFTAVTAVGATAVPLSARLPESRVRETLGHCGATATIGVGGWSLADLALGDRTELPVAVAPDGLAQIIYTSGTTGAPKGVSATHANLTYGLSARPRPLRHSRHVVHAFPIGTNAAQTMLCTALAAQPTVVVAAAFDPDGFAALAARHAAGSLFVVPAMAVALLGARVFDRFDLSGVVLVASSAAPLPPAVARGLAAALPDATIVNNYTSTESAPAFTSMVFDASRPGSVGRPAGGADLRVRRTDGSAVIPGETGEIWLHAGSAARAYYGDPAATAATFRDGWVRMGDLGYVDPDGYLYLVDREADLINTGAHKVSTLRVEAALHEYPEISEATVLGLPHPTMGSVVAAVVVADPPDADLAGLRDFLAARLAPYELPTRLLRRAELPRNEGGKVLKGQLREAFAAAPARSAPTTRTERRLARLWCDLLGVADVNAGDDFFALGGDSLSATRLAAAASEEFGVDVSVSRVFSTPVLSALAAVVDIDRARAPVTAPVPARPAPGPAAALTSTQESMLAWMYAGDEPRDVGPISVGMRVRDALDPDLLRRALGLVIARHEALRTVFRGRTARVLDECPAVVTALTADDLDRAAELVRADRELRFDVEHGPLVRAVVVTLAPDDHLLGLAVHHLVFDGASMGVLLRELGLAYSALRTGSAPRLPRQPLAYRDFVAFTRDRWTLTLPHWREALAGAPAYLDPFRGRRHAVRLRSESLEFTVPAAAAAALRRVAAAHGATPFMVIAACWAAILADRTDSGDVLMMSPVTGRTRPGSEHLIGCLVQSLLLRVDAGGDPSFAELLARVRCAALTALDQQHYPFAEFYDRHPGAAWLRVESWGGAAHFPGLSSEPFELPRALDAEWPTPGGEPDLGAPELAVVEQPDGSMTAWLMWNHFAFDATVMRELAGQLAALVEGAGADPSRPLSRLLASPLRLDGLGGAGYR